MTDQLIHIVLNRPKSLLAVVALITVALGYHILNLRIDFSLEQLFPEHDPERQIYSDFREDFALDDDVFLMVYETDDPFSPRNLDIIRDFTEDLEYLEGIESVISLANIERISTGQGILTLDYFFPSELDDQEIRKRRDELLDHPLLKQVVVSDDGALAAVMINLTDDYNTHESRERLLHEIDSLREAIPWKWHDAGMPILRTRYIQMMNRERAIFLPAATLIALLVLYGMFRQGRALAYPLIAISFALIWMGGLMALAGITINIVSYLTFNLLLIVGASNAIHILVRYYEQLNKGLVHHNALEMVLRRVSPALFLTSFTTATGFFSLITTNVRIVQEFGLLLALGVMVLFLLNISIIPALLRLTPPPDPESIARHAAGTRLTAARKISEWNESHPKLILTITGVVLAVAAIGITRISTNSAILEDLRPGNKVYDDLQFVDEHMGNILPLEVVLDTGTPDGITRPANLRHLQALKKFVCSLPQIGATQSIADHVCLLNETIGTGMREVPDSEEEILELLSLHDNESIESLVDFSYGKARISARVANINSDEGEYLKKTILEWAQQALPPDHRVTVTGTTLLALKTNQHLVNSLVYSFILAFVIIFISMMLLFRSFRLAALSILPNILPLLVVGGFMGFVGIKLRPTTAMTFAIAFGIAVDGTIHILARFRQEFKRNRGHYRPALRETLLTTGKAVISTTGVLFLGFSVLMLSRFVPQFHFGTLASLILLIALLACITLLPVLITLARPKLKE